MKVSEISKEEYHNYYKPYLDIVGDETLDVILVDSAERFKKMIVELPEEKLHYTYVEGKWTIAQLIAHLIDAERVFQYRALRFSRNDKSNLPGFDQDAFVANSNVDKRTKIDLLKEFSAVRESTLQLFNSFSEETLAFVGTASDTPMSVRAIGFMISGHVLHHLKVINERYLQS